MQFGQKSSSTVQGRIDVAAELRKLTELSTIYKDIGPTVAALAFKLGEKELAERLVRMAHNSETPGVEFYFVSAQAARREGRAQEALQNSVDAIHRTLTARVLADEDDLQRLLHLVRYGFAIALFDLKDVEAGRPLALAFVAGRSKLEPPLEKDHFYRSLLAQSLWYASKEASEAEWEKATELDNAESVWNARGTWYKDAENQLVNAERAYRSGLEKAPNSGLLLHNVGQILVDRAYAKKEDPRQARTLLNQADELLRRALRTESPKLRRHVHTTRDRLFECRRSLPSDKNRPGKGDEKFQPPRDNRNPRRAKNNRSQFKNERSPEDQPKRPRDAKGQTEEPQDRFLSEGKFSLGEALRGKLQVKDK